MSWNDTTRLCSYCFDILEKGGFYCGAALTPDHEKCPGCGLGGNRIALIRNIEFTDKDKRYFKGIRQMKDAFNDEWDLIKALAGKA